MYQIIIPAVCLTLMLLVIFYQSRKALTKGAVQMLAFGLATIVFGFVVYEGIDHGWKARDLIEAALVIVWTFFILRKDNRRVA